MSLYVSDANDEDAPKYAGKINATENKDFCHNVRKYLREYNEVTGIHGLRYLTEKRSGFEKVVWAIFLVLSLAGCIYMIGEILEKYNNSPVVVSFATEDTPIYKIPFPAVTICPQAKYSGEKFNYTHLFRKVMNGEEGDIDEDELKKFYHLSLLCAEDDEIQKRANKTVDHSFFDTIDELKPSLDSFLQCSFMGEDFECMDLFHPVLSEEGICYSFNFLNRSEIFKDHVYFYKNHYDTNNSYNSYNMESGYSKDAGIGAYPRRALSSGQNNNLVVFLKSDIRDQDFLCSSMIQGWTVGIHNPYDIPESAQNFFNLPFDKLLLAAIEPELITTSEDVRGFSPDKRKCFMMDEKHLQHFKVYTQPNCLVECTANYTLSKCGCVAHKMPRDNNTDICGPGSLQCIEDAEKQLKIKDLEASLSGSGLICDCKPSCAQLKFNVETSHSHFYANRYFEARNNYEHLDDNIFHWSALTVFYKNDYFMPVERNQLYGISDLISNFGGLLGLFTGFSLISLAEIIYFLTLRMFCNERLYGMWSGPPS